MFCVSLQRVVSGIVCLVTGWNKAGIGRLFFLSFFLLFKHTDAHYGLHIISFFLISQVILFTLFTFLYLTEAGKGNNKGGKRNRPAKLNSWGCPISKKALRLQLSDLDENGVFVVPSPSEYHPIRDGDIDVITSQTYTDRPSAGLCKEEKYLNTSNNRLPTTVMATRCICQNCENEQGEPTARCDPIEYQHNVLILPERRSERCSVKGLLRYEVTRETVTVGCKYTVF